MPDVDHRARLTQHVFGLLRTPDFRRKLRSQAADGSFPVVVALATDAAANALDEVGAVGGVANLVVPLADGLAVCSIEMSSGADGESSPASDHLRGDCTVGLLLARVLGDGGAGSYAFVVETPKRASGTAALTGVAG